MFCLAGGRLRKVVAHGGSTVQYTHLDYWHFELNCNKASAIAQTETSSSCLGKRIVKVLSRRAQGGG